MTVSWEIRQGDALERLREMPDESVHCCITSPPYYGLRDYGVPPPMPENVQDRPSSSHEHVFLLTKSPRYFYDTEAVREEDAGYASGNGYARPERRSFLTDGESRESAELWEPGGGRHLRDVWTLSSSPFPEAHFATFPSKLVEPCVLAGTSDRCTCADCGAPWRRIIEVTGQSSRDRVLDRGLNVGSRQPAGTAEQSLNHRGKHRDCDRERRTVGWESTCDHDQPGGASTVLDPFAGAGTTGMVALRHGRSFVGIELNPEYVELSRNRIIDDQPLMNQASEAAA